MNMDRARAMACRVRPRRFRALSRIPRTRLSRSDRRAIVLKYYEKKTFREIGVDLGIAEEAARKRVSRATKKLRGLLGTRGAIISESLLGSMFMVKFVHAAPSALASKIVAVAVGQGAIGSAASGMIAQSVARKILFGQMKVIAAYAAVFVIAFGAIGIGMNELLKRNQPHPEVKQLIRCELGANLFDWRHLRLDHNR